MKKKTIRTFKEGALAALTTELESCHSLAVDPTGSGKHVAEIKRVSAVPLPRSAIIRILLKKNATQHGSSMNKVSRIKQFTGRKPDAKIDLLWVSFGEFVYAINLEKDNPASNGQVTGATHTDA